MMWWLYYWGLSWVVWSYKVGHGVQARVYQRSGDRAKRGEVDFGDVFQRWKLSCR